MDPYAKSRFMEREKGMQEGMFIMRAMGFSFPTDIGGFLCEL